MGTEHVASWSCVRGGSEMRQGREQHSESTARGATCIRSASSRPSASGWAAYSNLDMRGTAELVVRWWRGRVTRGSVQTVETVNLHDGRANADETAAVINFYPTWSAGHVV